MSAKAKQRWRLVGLVAIGTMVLTLVGCGKKKAAEEAKAKAAKAGQSEVAKVRAGEAKETVSDETLAVTGSIFAFSDAAIASKIGGKVIAIGAQEGQRVGAGRVLVRLDDRTARADLKRTRAAVASARAALRKAMTSLGLVQTQSDVGVRSALYELNAARARLAQATEQEKVTRTKSGERGVDIAQAEANVVAAQSRLQQSKDSLRMTREKVETDQTSATAAVAQAQAAIQAATAGVQQAEQSLHLTESSTTSNTENARQGVIAAQNALQIRETGARAQERAQVASQVAAAKAGLATAQADYDRSKYLFDHGAVAKAQLDSIKLVLDTRREQLRQAEEALSLVQEGSRSEEIRIAKAQLAQAQEQLKLVTETRDREVAIRRQEVIRARQDHERAKEGLTQAQAALRAVQAARAQVPIGEQNVAQAEQALSQAEQAARLAHAGVSQAEVARQEVHAAKQAVAGAEQKLRLANSNLVQPTLTLEDIRQLNGALRQAEAAAQAAQVSFSDHQVVAPISGGISEKTVEVGEVVSPGQKLFRLVGDNLVRFDALVPEEKVRLVSLGSSVDVRVDALPDTKFVGHVTEIVPAADVRSRTFTVKVAVPNVSGSLKQGMFARGSIVVQRNKRSLRVPAEAVVSRDERNYIVRLEGSDQATPIEVEVGGNKDGLVEILGGKLMAGDRVAVEGAAEVTTPQKVQLIEGGR